MAPHSHLSPEQEQHAGDLMLAFNAQKAFLSYDRLQGQQKTALKDQVLSNPPAPLEGDKEQWAKLLAEVQNVVDSDGLRHLEYDVETPNHIKGHYDLESVVGWRLDAEDMVFDTTSFDGLKTAQGDFFWKKWPARAADKGTENDILIQKIAQAARAALSWAALDNHVHRLPRATSMPPAARAAAQPHCSRAESRAAAPPAARERAEHAQKGAAGAAAAAAGRQAAPLGWRAAHHTPLPPPELPRGAPARAARVRAPVLESSTLVGRTAQIGPKSEP